MSTSFPRTISVLQARIQHTKIKQAPTTEQWMRVRKVFVYLYLDRRLKLEDVRDILARQYGFNAPYVPPWSPAQIVLTLRVPVFRRTSARSNSGPCSKTAEPMIRSFHGTTLHQEEV